MLARDVCILATLAFNASTLLVKLLTGATKAPPSACTLFSSIAPLPANTKAPPPKSPFYWFLAIFCLFCWDRIRLLNIFFLSAGVKIFPVAGSIPVSPCIQIGIITYIEKLIVNRHLHHFLNFLLQYIEIRELHIFLFPKASYFLTLLMNIYDLHQGKICFEV